MTRTRNFDEEQIVTVTFGGREFVIRPQRRAVIERIMDLAYPKDESDGQGIKDMFKNWDRQFPVFALIFGCEDLKSEETKEVLKHLEQHMPLKAGPICYEDWWQVNEIDGFFLRGGMPLFPVNLVPRIKQELAEEITETLATTSA